MVNDIGSHRYSETLLQRTVPNVEETAKYPQLNNLETRNEIEELPGNMLICIDYENGEIICNILCYLCSRIIILQE
ncbi:MAG: hypothetical protein MUW56_19455 [Chryseobacterium sp.]|uniref:hypothetical protein n=1 Tax=Chryseobacterium sp. TaxID=1871047 RepID=UPI0025C40329|nr:hypothetical protein [Chryseobacterium sp.]MCJ7935739.1 hypothetical protein [Chryseobacterium sp.]